MILSMGSHYLYNSTDAHYYAISGHPTTPHTDAINRVPTAIYGPLKRTQDATAVLLKSCWMKKSKIISGRRTLALSSLRGWVAENEFIHSISQVKLGDGKDTIKVLPFALCRPYSALIH